MNVIKKPQQDSEQAEKQVENDTKTKDTTPTSQAAVDSSSQYLGLDLNALRLNQNFLAQTGVKKLLTTVPVRKPNKQDFIRVHADHRLETMVLELKDENETYLVAQHLWPELSSELVPKALIGTVNRQGVYFIWPVKLPGSDGRLDDWNISAAEAAQLARDKWIRIASNRSLGAYEVSEAAVPLPNPQWPDLDFQKLVQIAFKGRFIDNLEHVIVRRLRGEA